MPQVIHLQRILAYNLPLDAFYVIDYTSTVVCFAYAVKTRVGSHFHQVRIILYLYRCSFDIANLYFAQFRGRLRRRLKNARPFEQTCNCHGTTCRT